MKKMTAAFLLVFSFHCAPLFAAAQNTEFKGSGEVISADPLYGRVTIKHEAIKNFSGDGETEFFVSSPGLLKGIGKRDLIDFTIKEEKGNEQIVKITKTGVAPPPQDKIQLGKAVQDVLVATGEVAKGVTSPIEPAHQVVSGTVGATTDATGAVLDDASIPATKAEF